MTRAVAYCSRGFPLALLLVLVIAPPHQPIVVADEDGRPPTLRVWLAGVPAEPQVSSAGPCRIVPLDGKAQGRLIAALEPVKARLSPEGIFLGEDVFRCAALDLRPEGPEPIKVDKLTFHGTIRLIRAGERLAVINIIDAERYLEGVLGSEMPYYWSPEALKAQAVAARTYALYYREQRAGSSWDLTSTVEDQVYKGGTPVRTIREAVQATRGQVLLHEDKPFPAFYHSTCGGATESPGKALGRLGFDFIQGVECPFCRTSRHYRWQAKIKAEALAKKLASADINVGEPITSVGAVWAEDGTRAVKVAWPKGEAVIPVVDFRRAAGRMLVKSGKFKARLRRDELLFSGRGLGHGTGMCQYGARGMADADYTYERILAYYYRDTILKELY